MLRCKIGCVTSLILEQHHIINILHAYASLCILLQFRIFHRQLFHSMHSKWSTLVFFNTHRRLPYFSCPVIENGMK